MARKKIVAGNWKMNLNWSEATDLVSGIQALCPENIGVEKIIFPPFPYLKILNELIESRPDLHIGAQNCSEHSKGPYTGEVSAEMIKSVGASFVLIGHSERRQYFHEKAEQLIHKMEQALAAGLRMIFCFGEQLAERKNNQHFETVKQQLEEVLLHFPKDKVGHLILAYEPVWAIGTGETASAAQAQEMHAYVRGVLAGIFDELSASDISILYGGSCNAQNAAELFSGADVDGGLIGGASLKAEDFCKIINSF